MRCSVTSLLSGKVRAALRYEDDRFVNVPRNLSLGFLVLQAVPLNSEDEHAAL